MKTPYPSLYRPLGLAGLFLVASLPRPAYAEFTSLACYNVADSWMQTANTFLLGLENAANNQIDQYVSLLNFSLGSSDFGVQGGADIGRLKTPPFSCSNPKATLKSGMADFGISPHYVVLGRIFGVPINVLDARMEGGQGPQTGVNRDPSAKDRVRLSVKVIGIDVLNRSRRGPETEAMVAHPPATSPAAGALPSHEKMGTGGKLFDISRSISDTLGGRTPRIDIIAPFLYVTFDAGFFLQSDLTFTYGVSSAFFDLRGSASFEQVRTAMQRNPANDTTDYCEAPEDTSGTCTPRSSLLSRKTQEFYQTLKGATDLDDHISALRREIRTTRVKSMIADARATKEMFGSDWGTLTAPGTSLADRRALMEKVDFDAYLRPLENANSKISAIIDQASGVRSAGAGLMNKARSIATAFENGMPEVQADAGIAFSGKVGAWADAMLVIDAVVAKAWAGVQGRFTLIDLRAGLGASLNTGSQYVDLTATLEQIRMMGQLDLVYGVTIGIDPLSTNYSGTKNLVSWPGSFTRKQWLAGRVDFRPAGKSPLFWCWDVFGSSAIDAQRCADGAVSSATQNPALTAHSAMLGEFYGEKPMDENASCLITTADGRPVFTSAATGGACAAELPAHSGTALPGDDLNPHPLAREYETNPALFMTYLRDDANRAVKVFNATPASGIPVQKTYFSNYARPAPASVIEGVLYFANTPNSADDSSEAQAPMSSRLYSLDTFPVVAIRPNSSAPTNHSDPDLQIKMEWARTRWQPFSEGTLFVGDLPALPNDLLVEMAKTFRTGRCSVVKRNGELFVDVAGKPFPANGDPEGNASLNINNTQSECFTGFWQNATDFADPQTAHAACQIRVALQQGECFPPNRVVALVELANLSDADALAYFGQPNSPITGVVVPTSRVRDLNIHNRVQIDENTQTQDSAVSLFSYFFNGTGYGIYPYHDADSKRCGLPYISSGTQDLDHWFERLYHRNGASSSTQELVMHSHPSAACYAVQSSASATNNYGIGISNCWANSFKSTYNYSPPSLGKATAILCDSNNVGHRSRFAAAQVDALVSAAKSASAQSANGAELVSGIKRCIAGDFEPCIYTPQNRLNVQDGGNVDNPLALADCKAALLGNTFAQWREEISGNVQGTSAAGCIQQAVNPTFTDVTGLCAHPAYAPRIKSDALANAQRMGSNWPAFRYPLLAFRPNLDQAVIGECVAVVDPNLRDVRITGFKAAANSQGLAGGSSYTCDLGLRKGPGYTDIYHLATAAPDDLVSPVASPDSCWKALGFNSARMTNPQKANEYCAAIGNTTLVALFNHDRAQLAAGSANTVNTAWAEVVSQRFGGPVEKSEACRIDLPAGKWQEIFANAACYLDLSSLSASANVNPATLTIGRGVDQRACEILARRFEGPQGCKNLCALPIYSAFAAAGARVGPRFNLQPFASPEPWNCNCPYDPQGDVTGTEYPDCQGQGTLAVDSFPPETQPLFSVPLRSDGSIRDALSCHAGWRDRIDGTADGSRSSEAFCSEIIGTVQRRLLDGGYVTAPTTSNGRWMWRSYSAPIPGPNPVTVSTESIYRGSSNERHRRCEYRFARDTVPNEGSSDWVLEAVPTVIRTGTGMPKTDAEVEILVNGNFEQDLIGYIAQESLPITSPVHGGKKAVKVGRGGRVRQTVNAAGLKVNGHYHFSAYAKTDDPRRLGTLGIAVENMAGETLMADEVSVYSEQWMKYDLTLRLPAGAARVVVFGAQGLSEDAPSSQLTVDDFSLVPDDQRESESQVEQNTGENPGFESGLYPWDLSGSGQIVEHPVHRGNRAIQIGSEGRIRQTVSADRLGEGPTYVAAAYILSNEPVVRSVWMGVTVENANGDVLYASRTEVLNGGEWRRYDVSFPRLPGMARVRLWVDKVSHDPENESTVTIDDAVIFSP